MKKEYDFEHLEKNSIDWKRWIPVITVVALILLISIGMLVHSLIKGKKAADGATTTEAQQEEDPIRILTDGESMSSEKGAEADVVNILTSGAAENSEVSVGIDVSKFQGNIDWNQVANSGVRFAMIRVGYRATKTGELCVDPAAKYNMQEAQAAGIHVGIYFFSAAVNEAEAKEEADWVADYISQYAITFPVAFDCENYHDEASRQSGMSKTERTNVAIAFLQEIYQKGYTPMFYASANELNNSAEWEISRIEKSFKTWVAQYPDTPYPQTARSSYGGVISMWQFTNQGTVPGINKKVDMNVAYFGYSQAASAQNQTAPNQVAADPEMGMGFWDVDEVVTAKDEVNLRDKPGTSEGTVVGKLTNGETAHATARSNSGWVRLEYNGQRVYASEKLLTTDLGYKTPQKVESEFKNVHFTAIDDYVTPKDETALRTKPSVTDSEVVVVLAHGEKLHRTGVDDSMGFSRVEYNGQNLYCVSSYLVPAE